MPAVSKKQQKFFGIVRAIQKGEMAPTTPETAKAAADMKKGDVKKFASTKHKGLPEKKKIVEDKQVKKIIKQLRKSVKAHKKQADTLEKKVKTFKESAFSNITVGNKVAQTFQHASGVTITLDGALGGKMMVPSQVTLDLGFGEKITVDGPTESEFGLAGYTKPLDSKLQKRIADQSVDEINDKLDASQEASGAETAKVSDIPSETTFPDIMPSEAEMEANYEKFREGNPDLPSFSELTSGIQLPEIPKEGWTYDQYVAMQNAIRAAGAEAEEPIVKQILDYSPTGTKIHLDKFGQRNTPIGLIDAQSAITEAVSRALNALYEAWVAYNKRPHPDLSGTGDESEDKGTFDGNGNFTPADIPILGSLHSFATGGGEAKYVLDQANEIVDNANKNNNGVIEPGSRGSEQNPINTGLSFQTKKEWFKNIAPHLNIIDQIKIKSASNPFNPFGDPQGVMGVKAVHSQISDLSKGVQLDGLGGIDVNDTYAVRPDGFENYSVKGIPVTQTYANIRGALGGDKQLATQNFATTLDANFLNLVMKTPGRKDPIVYIKTNFSKNELVKMWGKKKYNEVMKKLKSELNVNESKLSFKLIQQFKEGLPEKEKIEEEIKTNRKVSFPEMQKRIRDAEERRRNQKKESEKLYIDIKRKGIKFYDKKGTGRIKKGKKVYD